MRHAVLDLLTGSACPGCAAPGHLLCPACEALLTGLSVAAWPTPTPPGLVEPWAAGEYAGLLRGLVLGYKERGQLGLAGPLGRLLADAVAAALGALGGRAGTVVLVPVPSRRRTVRARGHDATYALAREAARTLRTQGYDALPHRLLRLGKVADQAGLDAGARAQNLAGAMTCPAGAVAALARRRRGGLLVVCDDVLTTGATAREAQRALAAAGLPPHRVATVAATVRRLRGAAEMAAPGNRRPGSLVLRPSTD